MRPLRDFRLVLVLTAQEAAAALLFAGGLFGILAAARGDGASAWTWDASFFPRAFDRPAAAAGVLVLFLFTAALFLLTRLFLLGGVFGALAEGWRGMGAFRRDAHRAFGRFLLLALAFAVPAALLSAGVSSAMEAAGRGVVDSRWPLWGAVLGGAGLTLLLAPVAFLHAASRFRTLDRERLRFVLRLRLRPLLAFTGYSLPDLPLAAAMAWTAAAMMKGSTGWGTLPWIAVFEVLALARNALRLAAWRCARPPAGAAGPAGPRSHPEAEADPPLLAVGGLQGLDESQTTEITDG